MALVDYAGSDSDSDQEDEVPQKLAPEKPKIQEADDFFNVTEKASGLDVFNPNNEDVLEEIVKPKDWEKKLAEKSKKKLEKKAAKKALKLEKKLAKKAKKADKVAKIAGGVQKKEKNKVVISAFGALAGIGGDNSSDDSDVEEKEVISVPKQGSGFLSSLPAPKGKDNRSGGPSSYSKSLIPPSVSKQATSKASSFIVPAKPAPKTFNDSDNDDDDEGPLDFFGFSSAPKKREEIASEVPYMAMNSSMDVVGPSRPTEDDEVDPTQMYPNLGNESEEGTSAAADQWLHRTISDEQAHKLLLKFSHDIGPEERRSINEMASSIVDVNVDSALGPDVKTNILKNLSHRQFAESTSAPLPQVQTQGQTSRRKHQITYLASMAVAREEQLKDQWAQQKQTKRMARQKYGF